MSLLSTTDACRSHCSVSACIQCTSVPRRSLQVTLFCTNVSVPRHFLQVTHTRLYLYQDSACRSHCLVSIPRCCLKVTCTVLYLYTCIPWQFLEVKLFCIYTKMVPAGHTHLFCICSACKSHCFDLYQEGALRSHCSVSIPRMCLQVTVLFIITCGGMHMWDYFLKCEWHSVSTRTSFFPRAEPLDCLILQPGFRRESC